MTISAHKNPVAAWSLFLCQRQDIFNNHLALVPINPNQEETKEMRDEVLSSVGEQDLDTSGNQVSDLGDVDFYWENDQLDVDAVFRANYDTIFPL